MSEYTVIYHLDEDLCYCEKCWEYHNVKIPVAIYVKQDKKEKVMQDIQKIKTKREFTKYLTSIYKDVKGRENKRNYWYTCILHDDKENEIWMQDSYENFLSFKKDIETLKKEKVYIDKSIFYNWNKELTKELTEWFFSKLEFLRILREIEKNSNKKSLKEFNFKNKYTNYYMNAFLPNISSNNKEKICEKFVWIFKDNNREIPKGFRHLKNYLLSFQDYYYPFIKENYPTLNVSINDSYCRPIYTGKKLKPSFLSCKFYDRIVIDNEAGWDIAFLNCDFYKEIYVETSYSYPICLIRCNTMNLRYMFKEFSFEDSPNSFGNIYSTNIYGKCLVELDEDAKFYLNEAFRYNCEDVDDALRFINDELPYYYSLVMDDIYDTNFYGGLDIDSYISYVGFVINTYFYSFSCYGYLGDPESLPKSLKSHFSEKLCSCILY